MNKLKNALKNTRQPVLVTIALMLLCGFVFPMILTGISAVIFPHQANGSLIEKDGIALGSEHIGQQFTKPYFMKGRPSSVGYNTYVEDENGNKTLLDGSEFSGPLSGSNNYGPTNEDLQNRVENDIEKFLSENPSVKREDIPTDLLTASGSGLDPHISVKSAEIQMERISGASGISMEELEKIIENNTKKKLLGIFGEEYVNVLGVNLDIAERMGLIS